MESRINCCEIIIFLNDREGESKFDVTKLNAVLVEKACRIKEFAYIVHDKDVFSVHDEELNPEHKAGNVVPAHIHLLVRFNPTHYNRYSVIVKWFDVPVFLTRVGFDWEMKLLRLTQQDSPQRHQYSTNEITANFNVITVVNRAIDRKRLEYLMALILHGDPEGIIPPKLVGYVTERFLSKMRPYFNSPEGKMDFEEWLQFGDGLMCEYSYGGDRSKWMIQN